MLRFKVAQTSYSALRNAALSFDKFLEFPFTCKQFREKQQNLESIYVRQDYFDIFELIFGNIKAGIDRFVVTGTPGIGKTIFLYYFVW